MYICAKFTDNENHQIYPPHKCLKSLKINIKNPAVVFCLLTLAAVALPLTILFHAVRVPWVAAAVFAAVDSAVILLPVWWIKRRRWTFLIPVWISAIFVEINLMMLQWSGELMTFHSIFMMGNVDGAVTANIPALIHFSNWLILLVAVAYTVYYVAKRKKMRTIRLNSRKALTVTVAILLGFVCVQFAMQARWRSDDMMHPDAGMLNHGKRWSSSHIIRTRDLIYKGYVVYVLSNVAQLLESHDLSPEQKAQVDNYVKAIPAPRQSHDAFTSNRTKNLLLLVVESLDGEAVTAQVNGRAVMPVLRGLADAEGTVSALEVVTQIKDGSSGDGQLMINTGILPLQNGSASLERGKDTRFVALPKMFPEREGVAIFSENGACWAKNTTFRAFGFKRIVTTNDYSDHTPVTDGEMMSHLVSMLPTLEQPFLVEAVTMSMHSPFDVVKEPLPSWIAAGDLSEQRKRYYQACNHFDIWLGKVVDELKREGKWENTVLVVVSDHSMYVDDRHPKGNLGAIPMAYIAANTGVTERVGHPVAQASTFATTVDIMGMAEDRSFGALEVGGDKLLWRGFSQSMLADSLPAGAVDSRWNVYGDMTPAEKQSATEAFIVSDLMLRGYWLNDANK